MTEFDRIVDQVVEHLLNFSEICIHHQNRVGKRQIKRDVSRPADSLKRGDCILDHPRNIKIASGKITFAVEGI